MQCTRREGGVKVFQIFVYVQCVPPWNWWKISKKCWGCIIFIFVLPMRCTYLPVFWRRVDWLDKVYFHVQCVELWHSSFRLRMRRFLIFLATLASLEAKQLPYAYQNPGKFLFSIIIAQFQNWKRYIDNLKSEWKKIFAQKFQN